MPLSTAASAASSAVAPAAASLAAPLGGWLQYVQVIGTLIIALIAAAIAGSIQWRQMQISKGILNTANDKLRLDLFDKRLAIFDATTKLIMHVHSCEVLRQEHVVEWITATRGAKWLFDQQVQDFVDGLYERVDAIAHLEGPPRPDEPKESVQARLLELREKRKEFLEYTSDPETIIDQFMTIHR